MSEFCFVNDVLENVEKNMSREFREGRLGYSKHTYFFFA